MSRRSAIKYARKCAGISYGYSWTKGGSMYGGMKHAVNSCSDNTVEIILWLTVGPMVAFLLLVGSLLGLGLVLSAAEEPSGSRSFGSPPPIHRAR